MVDPSGYDGGKKIKGKKRHILVDMHGLLMQAAVHAADLQDRDGGVQLMSPLFGLYPFLLKLYADAGCQGPKFQDGGLKAVCRTVNVEIVRRRVSLLTGSISRRAKLAAGRPPSATPR